MPELTIITICLNDKTGLEKTIRSVLEQTFKGFEYIVIDGGSTDGSTIVIEKYADKIAYHESSKDNGIYHAMNKGLEKATGKYCLFLNSGDYLFDEKVLEKVFHDSPSEEIIYGDMMIDHGKGELEYGKQPDTITFEFMVLTTIWHPVSFIRRSLFKKLGSYNEELKIVADFEFFLKAVIINHASTRHLSFPVSVFNTSGIGSDPRHRILHESERQRVLEKYFPRERIIIAQSYNTIKRSRASILAGWLKNHPSLLKIAASAYTRINSLRKS